MTYKITYQRIIGQGEPYIYTVHLRKWWLSSWQRCRNFDKPKDAIDFRDSKPTDFEIDKEVPYNEKIN